MPLFKLPSEFKPLVWIGIYGSLLLAVGGCQLISPSANSDLSAQCEPVAFETGPLEWPTGGSTGELAKQFFDLAWAARDDDDASAPDYFYQAALQSWPCLPNGDGSCLAAAEAWKIYHASVAGLIVEGQRFGRFTRRGELTLRQPAGTFTVSFVGWGLLWQPGEIGRLVVVEPFNKSKLENYHAYPGFGVPVVAVREAGCLPRAGEQFLSKKLPFAVTVVLRPPGAATLQPSGGGVLEFYNPVGIGAVEAHGRSVPMARDLSATFDYQLKNTESTGLLGYLDPGVPEQGEGLRFVVPYQSGKIPVVFVHGLLSDPSTWFDVANDLQEQPWFNENYQVWAFRYATGKPFVTSALTLRQQLREAVATLDPHGQDPALRQMVIVGHSMGGLVAKLQVTASEDRIWNSFALVPLESLRASPQVKIGLAERCFFDPQPFVRRVVYVATPHGGSSMAARGIGRLGSALVKPVPEAQTLHDELISANPGCFIPEFERRVPTSMDMLEPKGQTLQTIRTLPVSPCVRFHSIIGDGRYMPGDGPGDGVVPVSSAECPGVASQRFIEATHTTILKHPETQAEIQRILREHLADVRGGRGGCQ